ncbi:hypothetical protein ACLOJK_037232, partial [Asimina triloba]
MKSSAREEASLKNHGEEKDSTMNQKKYKYRAAYPTTSIDDPQRIYPLITPLRSRMRRVLAPARSQYLLLAAPYGESSSSN